MFTETHDIILQQGLFDDEHYSLDFILDLWPELQRSSADAARAPALDLFSFVSSSFYFAVIYHKKRQGGSSSNDVTRSLSIERDVTNYESDQPSSPIEGDSYGHDSQTLVPVGCVVLTSESPNTSEHSGELSVSVIIDERYRQKGFARQSLELIMEWIFQDMHFHRLQAVIVNGPWKIPAATFFTQLGFGHEGIRRRSVYSQIEGVWKDATCLAILDTDWLMRSYSKPAPRSMWDEMFTRHDRERQALLRWEASSSSQCEGIGTTSARLLKRSGSVMTVRALSEAPEPCPSTSASVFTPDVTSDISTGASVPAEPRNLAILHQRIWDRPLPRSRSPSLNSASDISIVGHSDIEDQHFMVDEWRANVSSPPPSSSTPSDIFSQRSSSPESEYWDLVEDPFMGESS